jgi:acetyl-CoA carboxylase biotin carboxyl carrier protein
MPRFDIDSELVLKLANLLREAGLGEIEYEAEGRRIRVALPGAVVPTLLQAPARAEAQARGEPAAPASAADTPGAILSPMVGTVYLSPGPGEPPFVTVGQAIEAGQTVLLIEAMKTFNEVKAHRAGTLARILVSSGQAVEYGEILATVE